MMRSLAVVLLLLTMLPIVSWSQVPASRQGPSDTVILNFGWKSVYHAAEQPPSFGPYIPREADPQYYNPLSDPRFNPSLKQHPVPPDHPFADPTLHPPYSPASQQRYDPLTNRSYETAGSFLSSEYQEASAVVRNLGAKSIKAVSWEVQLLDPVKQVNIKRYRFQFRTKTAILPGEDKKLTGTVRAEPSLRKKLIKMGPAAYRVTSEASIKRIEYSDGTVWQRP